MKKFFKVCLLLIVGYYFLNYGLFLLWVNGSEKMSSRTNSSILALKVIAREVIDYSERNKRLPTLLNDLYDNEDYNYAGNDFWGNPIVYSKNSNQFTLISKGENGVLGDGDDLRRVVGYEVMSGDFIFDKEFLVDFFSIEN